MAVAYIPRLWDGACVCKLCCHFRWTSTYDCSSEVWGDPELSSVEQLAGTCPSDVTWYADAEDPCVYIYDQYVELTEFCSACFFQTPVPPAKPDLPEPSGCCDQTNCCYYCYTAMYNCETEVWDVTLVSSDCGPCGGSANPCDHPSGATEGWVQDALEPCLYYRTILGDECATVLECPSPPDPGNPGARPDGCCDTCCRVLYQAFYNCDTGWSTGFRVIVFQDVPCNPDSEWADGGNCDAFKTVFYSSLANCQSAPLEIPGPTSLCPTGCPPGCC